MPAPASPTSGAWARTSRSRAISEYAGSRGTLADGLPALAAAAGLSEIRMAFPTFDENLAYLLRRRGVALKQGTVPAHTFRVVNLPGLFRMLKPYLQARLTEEERRALQVAQEGETCRFRLGDEELALDLSQTGALLFGGPGAPAVGGRLGEVLAHHAIPLPLPGLNYA